MLLLPRFLVERNYSHPPGGWSTGVLGQCAQTDFGLLTFSLRDIKKRRAFHLSERRTTFVVSVVIIFCHVFSAPTVKKVILISISSFFYNPYNFTPKITQKY